MTTILKNRELLEDRLTMLRQQYQDLEIKLALAYNHFKSTISICNLSPEIITGN